MTRLPVIVGFGGVNAAGRSSGHHGYRRMVIDALSATQSEHTLQSLATMMNLKGAEDPTTDYVLDAAMREHILLSTLIRQIDSDHFDTENIEWNRRLEVAPSDSSGSISFVSRNVQLPDNPPANWVITPIDSQQSKVEIKGNCDFLLPTNMQAKVRAAGQLPKGFDPKLLYQSRNHPKGLQMTVFGASDALGQMGIDWSTIQKHVSPEQISVYAGSGMSQLDANGNGGMLSARLKGKKVTSKQCPLGFAEMPADFINAYILGSLGTTGTSMGACASFLYNLRQGLMDIQTGKSRVVIVGNSEAPITPEVMEGYAAMGALATDAELVALDKHLGLNTPNYQRACRPFADNCGFTIAESAQFIVLFDDELAVELGASIYGAVTDVFVSADGFKKSISSPGVGNYITFAKAAAAAQSLLGEQALKHRSFVQAHGTGTPQNRTTESHILNETAKAFGIEHWPVAAVKSYLGHSIGAAAGDQIMASLGVWSHGVIPGIHSIDAVAEDVYASNLSIQSKHHEVGEQAMDVSIINAKGFGGNNATANIIAPHIVQKMLEKKYGKPMMTNHQKANESVVAASQVYDEKMTAGLAPPTYRFNHNVLSGDDIAITQDKLTVDGNDISLTEESPYKGTI